MSIPNKEIQAWVPPTWFSYIAPYKEEVLGTLQRSISVQDLGPDFTQNWQCIFGILMASIVLVLTYVSLKSPKTRLHSDKLVSAFLIAKVSTVVAALSAKFGRMGTNPAIALAYTFFADSQSNFPNFERTGEYHYMYVYCGVPLVGGLIAGILHAIHAKCSEKDGKDGEHIVLDTADE